MTLSPGVLPIFMSAHPHHVLVRGGDIPVDAPFLEKPFSEERLAEVLAAATTAAR